MLGQVADSLQAGSLCSKMVQTVQGWNCLVCVTNNVSRTTNQRNGPLLDMYLYFPGCLDVGDSEESLDNRILKLSSLESQGSVGLGVLGGGGQREKLGMVVVWGSLRGQKSELLMTWLVAMCLDVGI